jgi:hypothetical protein
MKYINAIDFMTALMRQALRKHHTAAKLHDKVKIWSPEGYLSSAGK